MPYRIKLVCPALGLLTAIIGCDRSEKSSATSPTNHSAETKPAQKTTDNRSRSNPVEIETIEQHKERITRELLHARQYAKESYESNKKTVPDLEALRVYRKDLADIEQEAKDKGVQLPLMSEGIPRVNKP